MARAGMLPLPGTSTLHRYARVICGESETNRGSCLFFLVIGRMKMSVVIIPRRLLTYESSRPAVIAPIRSQVSQGPPQRGCLSLKPRELVGIYTQASSVLGNRLVVQGYLVTLS